MTISVVIKLYFTFLFHKPINDTMSRYLCRFVQSSLHVWYLHNGEVAVNADAGQEQDAAVHVDKVAEDVQVGAGEAGTAAVVQQDAGGQREVDQQVAHRQVDGVDDGAALLLGAEAENVECHYVEHSAYLGTERLSVSHTGQKHVKVSSWAPDCAGRVTHQEYQRVNDHQSNPEGVEVIVEPLVQVGQSLQVALHAAPVARAGRHRLDGGGAVGPTPGLRAADVHLDYEADLVVVEELLDQTHQREYL